MKNTDKNSDAGRLGSKHKSGGTLYGGASSMDSDRDRTKSGHGSSSDSTGIGKQSARDPPHFLNTKRCAGEDVGKSRSDIENTHKDHSQSNIEA
jgi:hypothetical protein